MSIITEISVRELIKFLLDLKFFAVALLITYSVLYIIKKHKNFKTLREVYGYPMPNLSNPIFGHMNDFTQREHEFRWHKELGKIFGFYCGDNPMLKVADLGLVNEIFVKGNKLFQARIFSDYRVKILEKSILFNKGQRWKHSRRLMQPALAQYRVKKNDQSTTIQDIQCGLDRLMQHFRSITRCTGEADATYADDRSEQYATKGYRSLARSDSPTGWAIEFSAYDLMQSITIDVIFRLAFNMDTIDVTAGKSEPNLKIVRSVLQAADKTIYKIAYTFPFTRVLLIPFMLPLFNAYRAFQKVLRDHHSKQPTEKQVEQADQPRRIYNILNDDFKAGNMTRRELRSNLLAICVAGFETTAATSSYVLWCIAKHSHCKERLRSEVLSYGIESEYLDMFIKEVMRMFPALPNFVIRTPHEDATLNGHTIKKGMSVYLSINSIHYDETLWPQPHKFDPERFAKGKTHPPGAYAPFGLGHRMCAGYQLALREMKTIVCEFMTNFDIQLIAPYEMTLDSSTIFLTQPSNDIRLRLVPISGSQPVASTSPKLTKRAGEMIRSESSPIITCRNLPSVPEMKDEMVPLQVN